MSEAQLEHSETILHNVHSGDTCKGRPCTIHNRSDHCMRDFPQHWRSDRRIMERICPCGIGHPDPDSPWHLMPNDDGTHGCCGHCRPGGYEMMQSFNKVNVDRY